MDLLVKKKSPIMQECTMNSKYITVVVLIIIQEQSRVIENSILKKIYFSKLIGRPTFQIIYKIIGVPTTKK